MKYRIKEYGGVFTVQIKNTATGGYKDWWRCSSLEEADNMIKLKKQELKDIKYHDRNS